MAGGGDSEKTATDTVYKWDEGDKIWRKDVKTLEMKRHRHATVVLETKEEEL